MLLHPTLQSLRGMKLDGMAQALQEQLELGHGKELEFEERFALLVDREVIHRQNKGFDRRLRNAKLKHNASLEDIDYKYRLSRDQKRTHEQRNAPQEASWWEVGAGAAG